MTETTTRKLAAFSVDLAREKVIRFNGAFDFQRKKKSGSISSSNK